MNLPRVYMKYVVKAVGLKVIAYADYLATAIRGNLQSTLRDTHRTYSTSSLLLGGLVKTVCR